MNCAHAVAAIAGAILMTVLRHCLGQENIPMICGFLLVLILRKLAAHFRWNLPKVTNLEP